MGLTITPPGSWDKGPGPDRLPPEVKPGDPISHRYPNSWSDFLRMLGITVGAGLRLVPSSAGASLMADPRALRAQYIKVTSAYSSGDGGYSWKRVVRKGGAWVEIGSETLSSDRPAIEANGNEDVPLDTIVESTIESGQLIFQMDPCE